MVASPKRTIELAAGEGHLLRALLKYHSSNEICSVDIDEDNVAYLKSNFKSIKTYHADATKCLAHLKLKDFNLGLGNPPFIGNITIDKFSKELLKEYFSFNFPIGSKTRAEYIFIAQYLKALKPDGILAIILPETIISGVRSKDFRVKLLKSFSVEEVIEIPSGLFTNTEARTYALFIRNSEPKVDTVKLSLLKTDGNLETFNVSHEQVIQRMDYSSNLLMSNHSLESRKISLSEISTIDRGKLSHKELKSRSAPFIHSTNFDIDFKSDYDFLNEQTLINGDVIMCRVGSRVVGKARLYNGSPALFSDCIYRIRFHDPKHSELFLKLINGSESKKIKIMTRGVCSRYIAKSDLCNTLIPFSST